MAIPPAIRRKLFVHSAHRTVGVSTDGIAIRPYGRLVDGAADRLDIPSRRVVLAVGSQDSEAAAALTLFERAIGRRNDLCYRRVSLDSLRSGSREFADADCVVVFGRGLQVVRHEGDLDIVLPSSGGHSIDQRRTMRVEIAPAPWHPILEGVEPFASQYQVVDGIRTADDATFLLVVQSAHRTTPVAWIEHRHYGGVFCTSLGTADDFRQPAFVRLVFNAIDWVGGQ